jgi:hypothetical protein
VVYRYRPNLQRLDSRTDTRYQVGRITPRQDRELREFKMAADGAGRGGVEKVSIRYTLVREPQRLEVTLFVGDGVLLGAWAPGSWCLLWA